MLAGSTEVPSPANSKKQADGETGHPVREPARQSVTQDHGKYQIEGCSIRYKLINGNILRVITNGILR
jgi:hypothetical protein